MTSGSTSRGSGSTSAGDRLASVEPFFGGDVGLSRARINGWILEQAAVSRVSGVDPVDLTSHT